MSRALLSLACLSGTFAAVLDMPIWLRNTYSLVEFQVGTPAESHLLLFDTGSSTTWFFDSKCVNTDDCPNGSGYARSGYSTNSTTSSPMGTYASISYLGGVTAGPGIKDVFTVSNTTWNQTFMSANESSWFNIPCDGFLGLAFSTIADAGTTTLVETLMQEGKLDEPRFGLYYGTEKNDTGDVAGNGILTLGGSREDTYVEGEMQWARLQKTGANAQLWRTDMQYLVGSMVPSDNTTDGKTNIIAAGAWAVFDTGAGRTTIPPEYIEDVYKSIGMNWTAIINGQHIPLCSEFADDWSVSFTFGYVYNPATITLKGSDLAVPGFGPGGPEYCWPPFDSGDSSGLFLFGNDFLQQFYTVWDFGGFQPANYSTRVGFGALKEEFKA